LLQLAWPVVLARATQSVIGFSDALMVAPLGEDALAAVTTGALNTFAFIILPTGTVFILQSFAAQLRGRGELEAVDRYAGYGLSLALFAGVLAALVTPFIPALLAPFGYAPQVRAQMGEYLAIRLVSAGAAVGMEALGNWYGGLGNTRPAMQAGVLAMIANILLNYLLIEPRWGLRGYGVAGAAWASALSSWVGFFGIFARFIGERLRAHKSLRLGFRRVELVRVLRFGLPNGVNWFLEFSAFAMFLNVVVAHLGTTVLAAFNVVIQVNSISFMPAFGFASAGAIMVGEAIGRRAHDDVWPIVKLSAQVTCTFMGSVALVYWIFSRALMRLFAPETAHDLQLVEVGSIMLGLSAVWQLFDAVGITLGEALRAAGDTTWCMAIRICLSWLVFAPLGWAFVVVFEGGVHAVMGALMAYLGLLALALSWRFASGRWRDIDMVGEPSVI
jgi:MATE family multidrug resistance protein